MPYEIIVREITALPYNNNETEVKEIAKYCQRGEVLDLAKLIAAVNAKPRKPRVAKAKTV